MSGSNPHIPACSCCGKPGNKVDKLIQIAEDFYICNNCVEICVNMIVKDTGLPLATRFIRGILSMEPSAYAMCQAEARKAAAADMLKETPAPRPPTKDRCPRRKKCALRSTSTSLARITPKKCSL